MSNIIDKPWGWYLDYERHHNLVIKKIHIKPFQRFSLQKHFKRDEFWYIIFGTGTITIGSEVKEVYIQDSFVIPKETIHRLQGGADGITFLEVQRGECYENDIVRLEDDYNRN
jgi:mannose-6-phosphate isomerase-like protein (cupin superfamily)